MHLTNKEPIRSFALAASGPPETAGAPVDKIEITSEMIEAGVDELKGEYLNLSPGGDLYPQIVRNVFARMMEVSRKHSTS
jgi:hypothetical protein